MPGPSLNPKNMTTGTFLEEGQYTFRNARYCVFDYGGRAEPALAFGAVLVGSDGSENEQYWSAGALDRFKPSKDGLTPAADNEGPYLCAVGNATELNKGTNFGILQVSLLNGGYPENRLDAAEGNITQVYEGLVAAIGLQAQPQRNIPGQTAPAEGRGPRQVPVINRVITLPGEAPAQSGAAASTAPQGTNGTAGGDEALEAEVVGFLIEKLSAGPMERPALMTAAYQNWKVAARRQAAMAILNVPEKIAALGVAKVEGTTVSLA